MKKTLLVFGIIIIVTTIIVVINSQKSDYLTNAEIEELKTNSNLNFIINLEDFSCDNYSEENLLDVAWQFANIHNLIYETNIERGLLSICQ